MPIVPDSAVAYCRFFSCAIALLLFVVSSLAEPAQSLSILGESIQPGVRQRLNLDYGAAFLGDSHTTPVIVAHGTGQGPTLCLTAAVHGDEINGVEVIRRLLRQTDVARLRGTLIAVPAVNWLAFMQGSRETPERRDINRYFPGNPENDYASRLTHILFEKVLKPHCDYLVDLHTATLKRSNIPHLRADLGNEDVRRLAALLGELPILWGDGSTRMLRPQAVRAGITAVTLEFGSAETIQADMVDAVARSLTTLMQRLGMRDGQPPRLGRQELFKKAVWLRVPEGGLFLSRVKTGDEVRAGETVGVLVNFLGDEEVALPSPVDGKILGLAYDQFVLPGYGVAHVGSRDGTDAP